MVKPNTNSSATIALVPPASARSRTISKSLILCFAILAVSLSQANLLPLRAAAASAATPTVSEIKSAAPDQTNTPPPKPHPAKLSSLPPALGSPSQWSVDDLKSIERHISTLSARVSPAVVAVRVGNAAGSGVVISEDGTVLTVAHVCGEPDRDVVFIFPDGRTAHGKTLGTNHDLDAALMKITDSGKWPHVDVGSLTEIHAGDWVLALGHPGGFDPKRSMVVRLGRIIRWSMEGVQTDCTLIGGDSGGPLFDMSGRVIGIHSRIGDSTTANFHVPISAYFEGWDRLAKGDSWGGDEPPRQKYTYVGARGIDDPDGCRLEEVDDNSPAFKAGLKVGDIVTKINGQTIRGRASYFQFLSKVNPGDEIKFEIKRTSGETSVTLKVEPGRRRRGRG